MCKILILISILYFSVSSYAKTSYVPFARTLKDSGNQISIDTQWFRTDKIVDLNGEAADLTSDEATQRLDLGLGFKYGISNNLELNLGVNSRLVQSTLLINDESTSYSRTGLESGMFGFKYSFEEENRTKYALEGWYGQTMHSTPVWDGTSEPEEISLGDQGRFLGASLLFYLKTKSANYLEGKLSYRDPGPDLSAEFFTDIRYVLAWNAASLYLGFENIASLEQDAYTNDPENKPQYFDGASGMVNSINRQWSTPFIGLNFALGRYWRVETQYAQIYTGTSTDLGPRLSISLVRRNEETTKAFSKRDSQFKEYLMEGTVTKLSKSGKIAIVDIGIENGLKEGMKVDFYYFDYQGGNKLIGRGKVVKASASKSLVQITSRYGKPRIKDGTVVRAGEITD